MGRRSAALRSFLKRWKGWNWKTWLRIIGAALGVMIILIPSAAVLLGFINFSMTITAIIGDQGISLALVPDFGDDAGPFAHDDVCDDPRFEGEGMSVHPTEAHRYHDATDCEAHYRCGKITLIKSR